jgi:hypothetical protein
MPDGSRRGRTTFKTGHFGAFFEVGVGVLDLACWQRISSSPLMGWLLSQRRATGNPSMNRN